MPDLIQAQTKARPVVTKYLRRFPSDVEDVLQSAAVKALEHLADFRGDSQFTTWFMRIAINQSLMLLRRRGGLRAGDVSIEDLQRDDVGGIISPFFQDRGPDALELCQMEQRAAVVREELGKVSPCLREEARLYLQEVPCGYDQARKARRWRLRRELRERMERRGIYA